LPSAVNVTPSLASDPETTVPDAPGLFTLSVNVLPGMPFALEVELGFPSTPQPVAAALKRASTLATTRVRARDGSATLVIASPL
jgi:hypothetical protein